MLQVWQTNACFLFGCGARGWWGRCCMLILQLQHDYWEAYTKASNWEAFGATSSSWKAFATASSWWLWRGSSFWRFVFVLRLFWILICCILVLIFFFFQQSRKGGKEKESRTESTEVEETQRSNYSLLQYRLRKRRLRQLPMQLLQREKSLSLLWWRCIMQLLMRPKAKRGNAGTPAPSWRSTRRMRKLWYIDCWSVPMYHLPKIYLPCMLYYWQLQWSTSPSIFLSNLYRSDEP